MARLPPVAFNPAWVANATRLLSSKQKPKHAATEVHSTLKSLIEAQEKEIAVKLGEKPAGYVIQSAEHASPSDPAKHVTIDVYRSTSFMNAIGRVIHNDRPIGLLHAYLDDNEIKTICKPRTKAKRAYELKSAMVFRINALLSDLRGHIPDFENNRAAMLTLVHHRLSSIKLHPNWRPTAFESVIELLMQNGYLEEAISVYKRMIKASLTTTPFTDAGIAVLSIAASPRPSILKLLSVSFADPHYTESSVLRLLDYLDEIDHPFSFLIKVVQLYFQSRPANYAPSLAMVTKLVALQLAKDDCLRGAFDWNTRNDRDEDNLELSPARSTGPYAALLEHINTNDSSNAKAVDMILAHMKSHDVSMTTDIFNTLLTLLARHGAASQAFSAYNVLVRLFEQPVIHPNGAIFRTLFKLLAIRRTDNQHLQGSENMFSPRMLYRELLTSHATRPNQDAAVVTAKILNLAFQTFLTSPDYPAALVAIRSFATFHLKPDRQTYYIMMKVLMDRLCYDMRRTRRDEEIRWGDLLLGITWRDAPSVKVDDQLAESILAIGKSPSGSAVTMPSLAQIYGDEPLDDDSWLDVAPLERILRKAVLADVLLRDPSGAFTGPQLVSQAIRQARKDMLPSKGSLVRHKTSISP